jgi:hypothetical protein
MWEAIAGLLAILLYILKFYAEKKAGEDLYEKDLEDLDRAIAGRDTDALSLLFERMRAPGDKSDTGGEDDKETP